MKKLIVLVTALVILSFLSCQDGKDEMKKNITDFSYHMNIGGQIPTETGLRWIDAYRTKTGGASRVTPSGFSIDKSELETVLASVESLIGVTLHHATDDNGAHHILIIPIDVALSAWSPSSANRIIFDSNNNVQITSEEALKWTSNYKLENPDGVWSHFFGRKIFDEMMKVSYFETLEIEPSIKTEDSSPQLLLIINSEDEIQNGRTTSESETMIYDKSAPCPSGCLD